MSQAETFVHNHIVSNLIWTLVNAVGDLPCIVLPSGLRLRVPLRNGYVYPDVLVVCGEPRFMDEHTDLITNPQVVVEVLSDSTERFDRGEKFTGYRSLPSMRDYLMVPPDRMRVEHYTRTPENTWVLRELGPGARLRLSGLPNDIVIDDIYRKVALPEQVALP